MLYLFLLDVNCDDAWFDFALQVVMELEALLVVHGSEEGRTVPLGAISELSLNLSWLIVDCETCNSKNYKWRNCRKVKGAQLNYAQLNGLVLWW